MRVAVGGSLMWRNREYTVLFIERDSATLRDEDGGEVEVAIDELGSDATPVSADTSGLLQLSLQVEDIEPGMDPWLQSCIRIDASRDEVGIGKAVETEREWLERGDWAKRYPRERWSADSRRSESRGRRWCASGLRARAHGIRASSRQSTMSSGGGVVHRR